METEGQYCLLHAYVVSRNLCCLLAFCVSYVPIDIMFIKLSHDSMFVCIWLMVGCNLCVELNILNGYMYHVPVLSYRFPIIIDMFPTDMFCSRYPVISVPFSRSRFCSRQKKKTGTGTVWVFSRPFSTLIKPVAWSSLVKNFFSCRENRSHNQKKIN